MSTLQISNEYTLSIPSDIIKAAGLKKEDVSNCHR